MTESTAARLLLVDDHDMFRTGLRELLAARTSFHVAGEARSAEEALTFLDRGAAIDVVVLDIGLAGMNGVAAAVEIRRLHPAVGIVVLTMYKDEEYLAQALKAGASGYVLKEAGVDELSLAISSARKGDVFVSPAMTRTLVRPFLQASEPTEEPLTSRQVQVLCGFARGMSTRDVAQELGLSPKTVESHRAQLMERLGLRSIAALVLYAVRHGYIRADEQ